MVVKVGGSTLGEHDTTLRDIAAEHAAGRNIVLVHGGGAAVSAALEASGIAPVFVRGLRVTDARTLETVVAVLAGAVNKQLVAELTALGVPAFGLSGADGAILRAHRYDADLGFVGMIERVDPGPIATLIERGYAPVIAPIAVELGERSAQLLNTNADTAAGAIAAALNAAQLIFLTDVDGVLDSSGSPRSRLTAGDVPDLIASGVASGGMIPKLEAAVHAAAAGCTTRIVSGTRAGVVSAALRGEREGTAIVP